MKKRLLIGVLAGGLSLVAILGTAPAAQALSNVTNGDPALITATRTALGNRYHNNISAAFVDLRDDTTRYANFGASNTTHYELGSITKTFVGQLFADSIARGEVTPNQKVGTLLPIPATKAFYNVTLAELATHKGGIPTVPNSFDWWASSAAFTFNGSDPYTFSKETLYTHAINSYNSSNRGKYIYSNMGISVLGHALAAAAGTTYKQLEQNRLLTPLGMTNTILPETAANLPAGSPLGKKSNGAYAAAWTMNGYAPSGGARADITDMANYAKQLLLGTAPGMDALNPKSVVSGNVSTGWTWGIHNGDLAAGRTYIAKNGGTGGFTSIILLDRERGTAAVILSDTAVIVDNEGISLMNTDGR